MLRDYEGMLDRQFARDFASEWIAAWNSHDLDRILSHYTDNFEMRSPYIIERMNIAEGILKGKGAVRPYWELGLAAVPPLRFELETVFVGVGSITIGYRRAGTGRRAAETLFFDGDGRVILGVAHYE